MRVRERKARENARERLGARTQEREKEREREREIESECAHARERATQEDSGTFSHPTENRHGASSPK